MPELQSSVEYREIEGYPGYRVGSDGSVWSRRSRNGHGPLCREWRRLRLTPGHRGHLRVGLFSGTAQRLKLVHRLVLQAFVGPCPPGMECRHFPDPDPANNRLENLSWGTRAENAADRDQHGRTARGERDGMAALTATVVRAIRAEYARDGTLQKELAAKYGVTQTAISCVIRRKTWRHV